MLIDELDLRMVTALQRCELGDIDLAVIVVEVPAAPGIMDTLNDLCRHRLKINIISKSTQPRARKIFVGRTCSFAGYEAPRTVLN